MKKSDLVAGVLLLAVVLALWSPVLMQPRGIAFGLDLVQFYYWEGSARESLAQGTLPLWNPYIMGGTPFLANPQTGLFYPPSALLRLLPIHAGFNVGLLLHIWWTGLAMYMLMCHWGCGSVASFFSGISLTLGGFVAPRLFGGHMDVIYGVCWAPLALWGLSSALQTGRVRPLLGAGVALAMQFLAGFPQMTLYTGGLLVAYSVGHGLRQARGRDWCGMLRTTAQVAALPLRAVCRCAAQFLPTLELVRWSPRAGGLALDQATRVSVQWRHLITLVIPHLYYDPVNRLAFPDELVWEKCGYVGLLPLLLAPLALTDRRRRGLALFWMAAALPGFLLALGVNGPLYPLAWRVMPFFRVPGQFLFLWCLGLAALGGLVAAVITWCVYRQSRRALNYVLLRSATLVFAFNESQLPN